MNINTITLELNIHQADALEAALNHYADSVTRGLETNRLSDDTATELLKSFQLTEEIAEQLAGQILAEGY